MIARNIFKEIDGKVILKDISFTLNNGEKVILLGVNGSGKSTLLKTLAGISPIESGKVSLNKEKIAILKQEIPFNDYEYSNLDYIKKEIGLLDLEKRLHELENNLNDDNMDEYSDVLEAYLSLDGYNFEDNLQKILGGLNLHIDFNQKVKTLSGGEKIKVLLAIVLLSAADILLLDEPTNNLDIDAIMWLENYLHNSTQSMIIVSHDEEFVTQLATRIFELSDGIITEYNMSYQDYVSQKDIEYRNALLNHEKLEEDKKKLKATIQKQKEWANRGQQKKGKDNDKIAANFQKERSKKTSGKISQLTKELESIEDDDFKKKETLDFSINLVNTKGSMNISVEELVCGYTGFSTPPITLDIPFGTRLQIIGPNGSGKTTFIKTLLGEIDALSGKVNIGSGVKIGYISQNSFDLSSDDETIFEYITKDTEVDINLLFTMLVKFHIKYEDKDKKYNSLSPGERTRVNLIKLALNQTNVLVLDEASNHLDIEAIKVLEEVISSFKGTIISVSHNRKFNEALNPNLILNISTNEVRYEE